ncbi:15304_t:CDS:2 [Funneliformis mosseae]|uniref:15304_t:CDS:1 n=1 Tax=Funneliformis mosseae TaxID=27381 RepID=A0A9N9EDS9_FUNMO|nr:15304_t:CDS:2 [Funneliformis mosseae]
MLSSSTPSITNIPVITPLQLQQIQLKANLIQSSIDNYADKPFSTYRKKAIYKQIGCAVASANLPFSTDIIEDLNNDVVIKIQNFITNSYFITLSGDRWTSQTCENVYMDYKEVSMEIGLKKWAGFVTDSGGNYAKAR